MTSSSAGPHLSVRRVGREYDAALLEFTEAMGSGRELSIVLSRRPSFFDALEVEGRDPVVVASLAEREADAGSIRSVGVMSEKDVYLGGSQEPSRIGYLSSARVAEGERGGRAFWRSFREMERLHRQGRARLFLTTILSDNVDARRLLESGRAGLPRYRPWGTVHTILWPVGRWRWSRRTRRSLARDGFEIRRALPEDATALVEFWREHGSRRQFFPAYTQSDLVEPHGILRGIGPKEFWIAESGGRLLGTLGCWDQSAFRQWRVLRYPPALRLATPFVNAVSWLRGDPPLPSVGHATPIRYAPALCIRDDDSRVLDALLSQLCAEIGVQGSAWLAMAFHERDPLLAVGRGRRHRSLESRLYVVHWESGREEADALEDERCPYVEIGSL